MTGGVLLFRRIHSSAHRQVAKLYDDFNSAATVRILDLNS